MWSLGMAVLGLVPLAADQPAAAKDLAAPVLLKAQDKPIDVEVGHAAPWVCDLNGDGKKCLLVGQFADGKVRVYPINGSKGAVKLGKFEWFQAGGTVGKVPTG